MDFFPLFAHLKNRPVLLIGSGTIARRKAESLLKAGAALHVAAPEMSGQFEAWLSEGRITHAGPRFDPAMIDGKFLVIAATDDPALNQRIFEACEAAGTFCNSVDDPQSCSFIVPAVVNRSPLQVAISSGGSAPVLARHIRQKLEAQLPAELGNAAALAGRWRPAVKEHLSEFEQRRQFWEDLFDGPFTAMASHGQTREAEGLLERSLKSRRESPQPGSVTLVGAGPGDAGLLTLNALQALQSADVVFYDSLISEDIRSLVRKDADMVFVGKRAGNHSARQENINQMLVDAAQAGKQVVRLKGGDPFIFGRGGEECEALAQAGVAFRVVPGISSSLGATAYAGIPLTHRDHAQAVYFVTGNFKEDFSQPDWTVLSRPNQTVVLFMGRPKADNISRQMIAHGRAPETPCAVIFNGTCSSQQVITGRLDELGELAQQAGSPSLLVIGEVVALRESISWFEPQGGDGSSPFTPTGY